MNGKSQIYKSKKLSFWASSTVASTYRQKKNTFAHKLLQKANLFLHAAAKNVNNHWSLMDIYLERVGYWPRPALWAGPPWWPRPGPGSSSRHPPPANVYTTLSTVGLKNNSPLHPDLQWSTSGGYGIVIRIRIATSIVWVKKCRKERKALQLRVSFSGLNHIFKKNYLVWRLYACRPGSGTVVD